MPLILLFVLLAGCAPVPPAPIRPALVVLIAVDQLRPDYFDRFGHQFSGGLRRLRFESTFFPLGAQDHAITETAPGHATMLSGRWPSSTGIVSNARGVSDPTMPLVGARSGPGASPHRFRGTTLIDWLRAADPAALALSVSRKDRSAILPVGRAAGQVYWYQDGEFTTSRYYADQLPPWVVAFNAREGPARLAGTWWTPLLPESAYAEPDSIPFENHGAGATFPHPLPAEDDVAARLNDLPWSDSLVLDFALEGARQLGLGQRDGTDLLSVGLSATDGIGHDFGPQSREIHDQILRLDRWLGWFLDSLATQVPADRMVLVLTADHGVMPIPEYVAATQGGSGGRTGLEPVARRAANDLRRRFGSDFAVTAESGLLTADVSALRARGVEVDSLARSLAAAVEGVAGVARVFTPATLAAAPATDREAGLWRHSLPPDLGWLVSAVPLPGFVWSSASGGATHGTTHPDDVNVPIAFAGLGIPRATVSRPARVVDIAPTLAALLGLRPAEALDGRVLPEVLGRRGDGARGEP